MAKLWSLSKDHAPSTKNNRNSRKLCCYLSSKGSWVVVCQVIVNYKYHSCQSSWEVAAKRRHCAYVTSIYKYQTNTNHPNHHKLSQIVIVQVTAFTFFLSRAIATALHTTHWYAAFRGWTSTVAPPDALELLSLPEKQRIQRGLLRWYIKNNDVLLHKRADENTVAASNFRGVQMGWKPMEVAKCPSTGSL